VTTNKASESKNTKQANVPGAVGPKKEKPVKRNVRFSEQEVEVAPNPPDKKGKVTATKSMYKIVLSG
jgi:hypothetical protein